MARRPDAPSRTQLAVPARSDPNPTQAHGTTTLASCRGGSNRSRRSTGRLSLTALRRPHMAPLCVKGVLVPALVRVRRSSPVSSKVRLTPAAGRRC